MSGSNRLQSDPLFQGLTRPTMIMGVSFMYFVCNAGFNFILFINTQNFTFLVLTAPSIHALGYYICLREPRMVEMIFMKAGKGYKCLNSTYHGGKNSYDPF